MDWMDDEDFGIWQGIADDIKRDSEEKIVCVCEMLTLLRVGCKCGGFQKEQEREEKKREEAEKSKL